MTDEKCKICQHEKRHHFGPRYMGPLGDREPHSHGVCTAPVGCDCKYFQGQ